MERLRKTLSQTAPKPRPAPISRFSFFFGPPSQNPPRPTNMTLRSIGQRNRLNGARCDASSLRADGFATALTPPPWRSCCAGSPPAAGQDALSAARRVIFEVRYHPSRRNPVLFRPTERQIVLSSRVIRCAPGNGVERRAQRDWRPEDTNGAMNRTNHLSSGINSKNPQLISPTHPRSGMTIRLT